MRTSQRHENLSKPVGRRKKGVVIETLGELTPVGNMIELIRSPETGDPSLLLYEAGNVTVGSSLQIGRQLFVPATLDESLWHAIALPVGAGPSETPATLIHALSMLFQKYSGLPPRLSILCSFFAVSSWVVEGLQGPVQVRVVGALSIVGTQLLRLLGCLCRRSLLFAEFDTRTLCRLPHGLNPTIIITQPLPKGRLRRLLDVASSGPSYIQHQGTVTNVCYPLVCRSEVPDDGPRCAVLEIPIANTEVAILDARTESEIVRKFQRRLLGYRLRHLHKIQKLEFDVAKFEPWTRQIAIRLGPCACADAKLAAMFVEALEGDNERNRLQLSTSVEACVAEALLSLVHDSEAGDSVHVKAIAERLNVILAGRGATEEIPARKVGHILRVLGLPPRRLDNAGRGILLLSESRKTVHKLARDFRVPTELNRMDCEECKPATP